MRKIACVTFWLAGTLIAWGQLGPSVPSDSDSSNSNAPAASDAQDTTDIQDASEKTAKDEATAGDAAATESSSSVRLPDDFSELLKLKTELIDEYRRTENQADATTRTDALQRLFRVEVKLLDLVETELGLDSAPIVDDYRRVAETDGAVLASQLLDLSQFDAAADIYRLILAIAKRRPDYPLVDFNRLLFLTRRAERLAASSPEHQQTYQETLARLNTAAQRRGEGDLSAAIEIAQAALPKLQQLGGVAPDLAGAHVGLAVDLRNAGRLKEALDQINKALQMHAETLGQESEPYATALYRKGEILVGLQRWPEAANAFQRTAMIESRIAAPPESQMMTLDALAGVYLETKEQEKFDSTAAAYRNLELRSSRAFESLLVRLPVDTFAAVTLQPAALLRSQELSWLPIEIVRAAWMDWCGIDPGDVQSLVALVTLPVQPDRVEWAIMMKPIHGANITPRINQPADPIQIGDQTFRQSDGNSGPTTCWGSLPDGTVLIGSQMALEQIISLPPSNLDEAIQRSAVAGQLASQWSATNLVGTFDIGKVQVFAQAVATQMPPLPRGMQSLSTLPQHLAMVTVAVAPVREHPPTANPVVRFELLPRADSDARKLQKILADTLQFAKQQIFASALQTVPDDGQTISSASRQYLERVVSQQFDKVTPKINSGRLTLQIDRFGDLQIPFTTAILVPAIQAARTAARRTSAANQLRQLGLALHMYHDEHRAFPPRRHSGADGTGGLSWRVQILPMLGHDELYQRFHLDEPWDSKHNQKLIKEMPEVFRSPSADLHEGHTNFLAIEHPDAALGEDEPVGFREITDGTSSTILLVESDPDAAVIWTRPKDLAFDPESPLTALGGVYEGGFHVLRADAAIELLPADIAPDRLTALVTRAGGEKTGD